MNIRYIRSAINNFGTDTLVKLLSDMILGDANTITNFDTGVTYVVGDRVYLEENGKHNVYQCVSNNTSGSFNKNDWVYLMEAYTGPTPKYYALKMKEESHVITAQTASGYQVKMSYNRHASTITVFNGKSRLVKDLDFSIDQSGYISFFTPITVGNKIVIEVREKVSQSVVAGVVFYDLDGNPYQVTLDASQNLVIEAVTTKDPDYDAKEAQLVTGNITYTMMIDSRFDEPELAVFEDIERVLLTTSGVIKTIRIKNNILTLSDTNVSYMADTREILGSDGKVYTIDIVDNNLVATEVTKPSKDINSYKIGVKTLDDDYQAKMIDVNNGIIRIVDFEINNEYEVIMFKDRSYPDVTYSLFLDENRDIQLTDENQPGTKPPVALNQYTFIDENWILYDLYVDDGILYFEPSTLDFLLDSRGIDLIAPDGEVCKLTLSDIDDFRISRVINLDKNGTFRVPLTQGFVLLDNGARKVITINKEGTSLVSEDAGPELHHTTDFHYIMGQDGKLYRIKSVDGNVKIEEETDREQCFIIHKDKIGSFIKADDVIARIDISDGIANVEPISTFTHYLKSDDGTCWKMDIVGDKKKETVQLTEIPRDEVDYNQIGVGRIFLRNNLGEYYAGAVINGTLEFNQVTYDPRIDYNFTQVVYSSQGWYGFQMMGSDLSLIKMFDDIFDINESFGASVRRDFIMEDVNNNMVSLYADGSGHLALRPAADRKQINGTLIRSNTGVIYLLGIMDDKLCTVPTNLSIQTNRRIPNEIYIRDIDNGNAYYLSMDHNRLCVSEYLGSSLGLPYDITVYNAYNEVYLLQMASGRLTLVENIIEAFRSDTDTLYTLNIGDKVDSDLVVFEPMDPILAQSYTGGMINIMDSETGLSYDGYIVEETLQLFQSANRYLNKSQVIKTNKGIYKLTVENEEIYISSLYDDEQYIQVFEDSNGTYWEFDDSLNSLKLVKTTNIKDKVIGSIRVHDGTSDITWQSSVGSNGSLEFRRTFDAESAGLSVVKSKTGAVYEFNITNGTLSFKKISNGEVNN